MIPDPTASPTSRAALPNRSPSANGEPRRPIQPARANAVPTDLQEQSQCGVDRSRRSNPTSRLRDRLFLQEPERRGRPTRDERGRVSAVHVRKHGRLAAVVGSLKIEAKRTRHRKPCVRKSHQYRQVDTTPAIVPDLDETSRHRRSSPHSQSRRAVKRTTQIGDRSRGEARSPVVSSQLSAQRP